MRSRRGDLTANRPHLNLCANTPWNSTPMTCSSSLARWCRVDTWRRSAAARSAAAWDMLGGGGCHERC